MWIPRQPEESDDSYHRRVSTKARDRRQGIKFRSGGGKDLGLKKLPSDDTSDELIVVSAQGVPKDWDAEDFSKFLIAQNWTEIESLQRKPANKRTACWNFRRGIPPKDQVNGPWKFSDDTEEFSDFFIHMSKQTWPMPPPKRRPTLGDFTQEILTQEPKDSNKKNGSIPPTLLDTQDSQQHERERSPRRQQDDSAKASASLEENTRLPTNDIIQEYIAKGWDRRDLGGAGDCGWRCLAASTKWWAGEDLDAEPSKAKGALIKTQTISHIRKHFDRYASFIKPDADDSPDAKTIPPSQRVEEFLKKVALPETWIDGKRNQTWQRCCLAPAWKQGRPKCASNKEPVVLILEGGHYTWFAPQKNTKVPEAWLRESAIPEPQVLAGAAPKRSKSNATSEATPSVHTMMSKSKNTPSLHTMVGQSIQKGGDTLQAHFSTISQVPSRGTSAGKRKRLVGKQKLDDEVQITTDSKVWTCPLCRLRIEAPNTRVLGYRRGNHFNLRHPGTKRLKKFQTSDSRVSCYPFGAHPLK